MYGQLIEYILEYIFRGIRTEVIWTQIWDVCMDGWMGSMKKDSQGPVSIRKTVFPGMGIPMLKIRRPVGRLIFNMGIAIPGKTVFLIETAPCSVLNYQIMESIYISHI